MAQIKERPIIVQAESVRAILAGSKSESRRVIKPQPRQLDNGTWWWSRVGVRTTLEDLNEMLLTYCPYGQPGDLLYVREAWATEQQCDDVRPRDLPLDARIHYMADGSKPEWAGRTRSARFMLRRHSCVTLELTGAGAERLWDITDKGLRAEGWEEPVYTSNPVSVGERALRITAGRDWFIDTWDAINAKKGYAKHGSPDSYPWASNCWVWVLRFREVK